MDYLIFTANNIIAIHFTYYFVANRKQTRLLLTTRNIMSYSAMWKNEHTHIEDHRFSCLWENGASVGFAIFAQSSMWLAHVFLSTLAYRLDEMCLNSSIIFIRSTARVSSQLRQHCAPLYVACARPSPFRARAGGSSFKIE